MASTGSVTAESDLEPGAAEGDWGLFLLRSSSEKLVDNLISRFP